MSKQIRKIKLLVFSLLGLSGLFTGNIAAQQDIFQQNPIVSPLINEDNSVTFKLYAPHADSVSVVGSMDAANAFAPITYHMKKEGEGVWSFTTPPLPPELYFATR